MSEQFYANGRVAVMSTKLFGADKFARLVECSSLVEAIKVLQENGIGAGVTLDSPNDYENLLIAELDDTISIIKELCFDEYGKKFLLCKYDYANAKALMKCKYLRQEHYELCFFNAQYNPRQMYQDFVDDCYDSYGKTMAQACDEIDSQFAGGNRSGRVVDEILDKAMFVELKRCASLSATPIIKKLFAWLADTTNVLLMYRAQRADYDFEQYCKLTVDGGKIKLSDLKTLWQGDSVFGLDEQYAKFVSLCNADKTLTSAERFPKSYQKSLLQEVDMLTAQPVLQYFFDKVDIIDKIRLVLVGIKNGLPKDVIKENLK